jgi:hypothetical protein
MADRTIPTQQPVASSTATKPEDEHHYGRNAALVGGGATAAGLGAYAATRDHEQQPLGSSNASPNVQQSGTYQPIAQSTSPQHVPGNPLTGVPEAQPKPAGLQTTQQQPPLGQEKEHHYGRNAALAGGATAATGAAGYAALDGGRGDTGPASKTIGPHDSNIANIVDPRVRPEPEKMKDHTTSGPWQSDTLNKLDPKVESDPYKADVKAHGYATGEPTMPVQLQQQQQVPLEQDKQHHYGRDAALVGGAGAAGYGASQVYDKNQQDPLRQNQQQVPLEQDKQHHYGRDATLVGGTGAAAYGASQVYDKNQQDPLRQNPQQPQQVPLEQDKQQQHHYGRDAALVGGAGAAGYGASQVYDKHEQDALTQKEQEKLLKEREKQAKHDAKEHDKQAKHDAHEADKAHKKEQEKLAKEHAKEQEKAAKEHAKEQEKLDKHHAKEAEKAEEKRQKELEKLEKEKEKENQKLAAARADEAEAKHKEHNKLHKDPPEEREKKDGILHRIFHHKQYEREPRPEGRGESFDNERPKGLEYKDADEERFARQHEQLEAKRSLDTPGHAGLPGTTTAAAGSGVGNDGIVTEPHTGLPMNVGKYGSGAGGTDGGEHIAGYGEHVAGYHAK